MLPRNKRWAGELSIVAGKDAMPSSERPPVEVAHMVVGMATTLESLLW